MKPRFFIAVTVMAALSAFGDPPTITFTAGGVTLAAVKPGTKLVWLGMIREPEGSQARVRFVRGLETATPAGKIEIGEAAANQAQAIWVVADVSSGDARRSAAPNFVHSPSEIVIDARPGATSIDIESAMVELVYVRPRGGGGAWSFGTGDGSLLDGDHENNGTIRLSLSSLKGFQGNPHPPEQVQEGDVILAIDPVRIRSSQLAVKR